MTIDHTQLACPQSLVAISQQLGGDPSLVLHGGGNTSLKTVEVDIDGQQIDVLWMKASGSDLAQAQADFFAPLRLTLVRRLLPPTVVPEASLHNELRCALLDASAADPSVETLVHAVLPAACVLHSHADALLVLTHSPGGTAKLAATLGEQAVTAEYEMPGPELAAAVHRAWQQRSPAAIAVVVPNHGIFVVGDTPEIAWQRHQDIMSRITSLLPQVTQRIGEDSTVADPLILAQLRHEVCQAAGRPMLARSYSDAEIRHWLQDPAIVAATGNGPLTPDHATRTKPWPMLGRDVASFTRKYQDYFERHRQRSSEEIAMLDPAPRVVLDEELGLVTFGENATQLQVNHDIARHTLAGIEVAENMGGYQALDDGHVFDLEYWSYQRAKMSRAVRRPQAGRVVLVTGAASGIGKACAEAFLDTGAAVIGWDLNPEVSDTFAGRDWLGQRVDVTDAESVTAALAAGVRYFGGIDVVVLAAGIFPGAVHLAELEPEVWRRVMNVNVDSVQLLLAKVHPYLKLAPGHGHVGVIASKNVLAPGPGAAAYSASKAALTQLCRIAALEWAPDGIRVNMVHPDAVFDTGLWTEELLAKRAEHYGMSVADYKRRNLLRAEITSRDVGNLIEAMCGPLFDCTTGAQVPIDGGNERVI